MNVGGSDWGWGDEGYWGAAALGAVTGAAIANANEPYYGGYYGGYYGAGPSTVVYSLPSGCSTTVVNGVTYQNCGGTYYEPYYEGSTVAYQAVPAP